MSKSPRVTSGALLVGIGALHQLVGVIAGLGWISAGPDQPARAPLAELVRAGLVDAVEPDPWRMTSFWFLMTGFVVLLLGAVVHHAERAGVPPTRGHAAGLGAIAVVGALAIPISGFWLVLAPVALMWRRARPVRR